MCAGINLAFALFLQARSQLGYDYYFDIGNLFNINITTYFNSLTYYYKTFLSKPGRWEHVEWDYQLQPLV